MLSRLNWIRGAAVALAALGTVLPKEPVLAAGPRATVRTVEAKSLDIALSAGGTFTGRVVDHSGQAMEGTEVTVKQGQAEIARTITDRTGTFTFSNLKNGTYTCAAGATTGVYRVWTEKSAPPSANPQGLLIQGQNGARGQFAAVDGAGNLLICTIALITLGVAIATLVEVNNVQDKVNNLPHSP